MKKNLKEYVIVLTIIVLVGLLLIIIKNNILSLFNEVIDAEWQTGNNEEKKPIIDDNTNYGINYSDGKYVYNINCSDDVDYFYIKKIVMNKCQSSVETSCPENIVDEYNIYLQTSEFNETKKHIKNLYIKYGKKNIYY